MSAEMFAMVKVDQGGGDVEWVRLDAIESLRGHQDKLEYVGLASGRLIDAIGSISDLMQTMNDAVKRVAE